MLVSIPEILPINWRILDYFDERRMTRSWRLISISLLALWQAGPAPSALRTPALVHDVGGEKQLFIDTLLVEQSSGITLVVNPPRNTGEGNLASDRDWEEFYAGGWNTVLEDGGVFKMWYEARAFEGGTGYDTLEKYLCYATSRDGIRWEKPVLGLVEFRGSRENNILMRGVVGTVFLDPLRAGGERYKFAGRTDGLALWIWSSPDGLRWRRFVDRPILSKGAFDTQNQVFWDDRLRKYVAYVRRGNDAVPGDPNAGAPIFRDGKLVMSPAQRPDPKNLRKVGRSESGELGSGWPEPEVVFSYDERDPAGSDHYNPCVIKYPYAADAYFMFPSAMYQYPGREFDGPLDIQMAASRDGVRWNRFDRKPYVRLGLEGGDDAGSIYMTVGMLRRGAELWMYYTVFPYTHGGYSLKTTRRAGVVRRLVQRLDGFVSADAAYAGGELTTVPVRFRGRRLSLNVDTGALGSLGVELQDQAGKPIEGYGRADCDPVIGNSVARTVTWRGKADLGALAGKAVRLRFTMRSTKLYAFQFADRGPRTGLHAPRN